VVDVPAAVPAATARKEDACGFAPPAEGTACFFPAVSHAEFKWSKAAISLAIVAPA
jgi:hypothetical protein